MEFALPHIIPIVFFLLCVTWGIGTGYVWILKPLRQSKNTKNWIKVPCTIEASELECEIGGDGPVYRPQIRYAYVYNNTNYTSNRYSFFVVSTSLKKRYQRIVESYCPGMQNICYINPSKPSEAILTIGDKPDISAYIFVFVVIFIGIFGLIYKFSKLFL